MTSAKPAPGSPGGIILGLAGTAGFWALCCPLPSVAVALKGLPWASQSAERGAG